MKLDFMNNQNISIPNEVIEKLNEIIEKHKDEINDNNYDDLLEECFCEGGKYYVKIILKILEDAEIIKEPMLYKNIDGTLYKRI